MFALEIKCGNDIARFKRRISEENAIKERVVSMTRKKNKNKHSNKKRAFNMKKAIKIFAALLVISIIIFVSISAFAATYHYDEFGRLTTMTWDSGRAISFEYDDNGNMINFGFRRIDSHGQLFVSINGVPRNETQRLATLEFASSIEYAENLIGSTYSSDTGINVPSTFSHWALRSHHEEFRKAIDTAQDILDRSNDYDVTICSFAPGESFDVVVRIDENIGFASMVTRLYIPEGLTLTGFSHNNSPGMSDNIINPVIPTTGSNYVVTGWDGRNSNITGNIDLLTFTITVNNNASSGLTEPFTISFENVPTNVGGDELKMMLPCGSGFGETTIIGGVIIN
jgi:YD repeat-containing protein